MSHRCPNCDCTVYGGDHIDRVCWTCESSEEGIGCGAILLLVAVLAIVNALVPS